MLPARTKPERNPRRKETPVLNLKKNALNESVSDAVGTPETPAAAPRASKPLLTIKPSKKACMVLAALMGGTVVASGGLFFWQTGQITETEKQVVDKQAQVADGEKVTKRLQTVEVAYNTTQNQIKYLETSVTASEYVPTMLKQMEDLARQTNLKVSAVRPTMEPAPKPPADKEARKTFKTWPYDKIHIGMDVSGSYWDVAKMLYRLTEFPKIMSVESVSVTPMQADATKPVVGPPQLNVSLKLTGFIFPTDGLQPQQTLPPGAPSASPGALPAPPASTPTSASLAAPSAQTAVAVSSAQAVRL